MSMSNDPPIPPENVRIVKEDGTEIPLEVFYLGTVDGEDGQPMHRWEAISDYMPQFPQDGVRVGTLPPRTEITLTMRGLDGP